SLVRGLRPRNAPSPTTSRRSDCVGNTKLSSRGGPRFPPASWQIPNMGQRKLGNALSGPTYTALTIKSSLQQP
ncbi:MAG: hypothetical protein OXF86_19855, partial [Caldilineaceae bacterium]|nr:hypothetical protein [Caldilineaceae bacterium]